MQIPSGYEAGMVAGARYVVRQEHERAVRSAIESHGSLSAWAAANAILSLPGRGETPVVETPGGTVVVRHYRRGGAVASWLGDRYLRTDTPRPFRELRISAICRAHGVRTPAVAAAVTYPAGPFYRGDIATDLVPEATTLADVTFGPARRGEAERRAAWHAAGRLLHSFVTAGLVHADLNLRNILIAWRSGRPESWLIDLDRCRIVDTVSPHELKRMKSRIRRSARRFEERTGDTVTGEMDAFEAGANA